MSQTNLFVSKSINMDSTVLNNSLTTYYDSSSLTGDIPYQPGTTEHTALSGSLYPSPSPQEDFTYNTSLPTTWHSDNDSQNSSTFWENDVMGNLSNYSNNYLGDDIIMMTWMEFYMKNFIRYKEPQIIALIALYIVSFLLGLLGNVLVIVIFTKNSKMRTVTNSFLVNLAVCDLLVVLLCMPISVAYEAYQNWIYGDAMCKLVNFIQGLSVSASIITLTVISAERFYAVNHPLKARAFMCKSRVIKIIVSIWIVSALLVLPSLIVRKEFLVEDLVVKIYTCKEDWDGLVKLMYNFAIFILLYILPAVFICIGYLRIGINLLRTDSNLHSTLNDSTSNTNRTLAGRRKVARMLFVMAILFTVSWLPFQIISLALDLLPPKVNGQLLRTVFTYSAWVGHTNSSINPICYCIMSQSFKRAMHLEIVRCCHGKYFSRDPKPYFNPSMSLTMSTSGALTRSRISTNNVIMSRSRITAYSVKSGYKPVSNDILMSSMMNGKNKSVKTGSLYSNRPVVDRQPDLLKHTNL